MPNYSAAQAGVFRIGGDMEINRLGYGAMRLNGPDAWGEPANRQDAIDVLRRVPELGINFVDTADCYGPDINEELIREAIHPYGSTVIATKGGYVRGGRDDWTLIGRPEYLLQQAYKSIRHLGCDQIDLWQLHRIDPTVPADEQFDAIRTMIDLKLVRYAGLSEVSVAEIEAASKYFKVATVQNRYNLVNRFSEDVLDHCQKHGIGFIPYLPLGAGDLAKPGRFLDTVAKKYEAAPGQVALAWMLRRSPVMIPIPGTTKIKHLEQNVAAAGLALTDEEFSALDAEGREAFRGLTVVNYD